MYLKSLTLKGFKSFADTTSLDLEPGVTVVVGPNGSGKSNVVDAIAWVLGAQGPRVVRSAKMDDVIFAGTERRSALGRAEVSLTIDNASRRLPIEFNEVTITRTLFRSGESEYALNGVACRLLDIQELLSDSGVGRQQHVIVSQGQLDVVLAQRPEDRRMILEEAAGVLKFRRRRERAERRLETSEAALQRLTDLLREVQRQVRPLTRQAASAIRHEQLETELRALRLFLFGRELSTLDARRVAIEDESRRAETRGRELSAELGELERGVASAASRLEESRDEGLLFALGRAERLAERARGLRAVCDERRRAREELVELLEGEGSLADLQAELGRTAAELQRLESEMEALRVSARELSDREAEVRAAEAVHLERFGDLDEDMPVEIASVRTEHTRARNVQARAGEDAARAAEKLVGLGREREENAQHLGETRSALEAVAAELDAAEQALARAGVAEGEAVVRATSARDDLDVARERQHSASARLEALELALDATRSRAGLERLGAHPGVLGTVLDVLNPPEELLAAVSAALDAILDAIVLAAPDEAADALRRLRGTGGDRGAVVALRDGDGGARDDAPSGLCWLAGELAPGDAQARRFAAQVLESVVLCRGGFEEALEAARHHPRLTFVTLEGDRLGPSAWRTGLRAGSASPAAIEATRTELASALSAIETARVAARDADDRLDAARAERVAREAERARFSSAREHLAADLRRSEHQRTHLIEQEESARRAQRDAEGRLGELSGSLAAIEGRLFALEEIGQAHLERTNERLESHRALEVRRDEVGRAKHELEVRLAALGEREALLSERELALGQTITRRTDELERARASEHDGHLAADVAALSARLVSLGGRLQTLLGRLRSAQNRRAATARTIATELEALRARRSEVETEIDAGREARQRLEIEAAEARVRRETALVTLGREFGASLKEAMAAPAPALGAGADPGDHAAALEAELVTLGPVNPLAREELAELEERSGFLETQLEDVRNARRELHQIIRAVDAEIVEVFTAAFADVETHFAALFELLFPGGSGRLVLTDPENPLTTGVDIEARPAGRNVRRLSLLSGGERSLTALAFLFAVFRSRPSPFYVLDEVEAALDEVNLRRFLSLVEEFRSEAQLIVVSHQKKTMEIADALYGVTMQPGGASRVVSERIAREDLRRELASP